MLGGFTSVVHAAASASWLRLLHARNPAALAVASYDAARLAVARGGGAQELFTYLCPALLLLLPYVLILLLLLPPPHYFYHYAGARLCACLPLYCTIRRRRARDGGRR